MHIMYTLFKKGAAVLEEGKKKKAVKVLIITLSVLLVISLVSLVGILLFKRFNPSKPASVTVSDNIITHEKENSDISSAPESLQGIGETSESASSGSSYGSEKALYLHRRATGDNTPFKVINMFPGDSETNYYCVRVSHKGDVILRFHADVRPGYEKLAEVLRCRITLPENGKVLYDGLMRDMPESLTHKLASKKSTTDELYYEITAYLDTSVGNDYQNKDLIADFKWWVEETGNLDDSPKTGDTSNILLWAVLAACSGSMMILLLVVRRRKEDEENV